MSLLSFGLKLALVSLAGLYMYTLYLAVVVPGKI